MAISQPHEMRILFITMFFLGILAALYVCGYGHFSSLIKISLFSGLILVCIC